MGKNVKYSVFPDYNFFWSICNFFFMIKENHETPGIHKIQFELIQADWKNHIKE